MTNNDKEIEQMAKIRCNAYGGHTSYENCGNCYGEKDCYIGCKNGMAILVEAGIGDKKQAVREYALKLMAMFGQSIQYGTIRRCINKVFIEFYGEEL